MPLRTDIDSLPLPVFRQLGLLCCRRLEHLITDKRFAKALRKLELSLGPPMDERMCRDAYNTIHAAYLDIRSEHSDMTMEAAVACTLVCTCMTVPNGNLLGNFERALSMGEPLTTDQIRAIEQEFFIQITSGDPSSQTDEKQLPGVG